MQPFEGKMTHLIQESLDFTVVVIDSGFHL